MTTKKSQPLLLFFLITISFIRKWEEGAKKSTFVVFVIKLEMRFFFPLFPSSSVVCRAMRIRRSFFHHHLISSSTKVLFIVSEKEREKKHLIASTTGGFSFFLDITNFCLRFILACVNEIRFGDREWVEAPRIPRDPFFPSIYGIFSGQLVVFPTRARGMHMFSLEPFANLFPWWL